VLFWGARSLQDLVASTIAAAPESTPPLEAVAAALEAAGACSRSGANLRCSARRSLLQPELQERELIKLASLAAATAAALRQRGVSDPAATLTAEAAIVVFKVAFERWINDTSQRALPQFIRDSLEELKAVTAGRRSPAPA